MWDYSRRKDSTQVSDDELKAAEIDERVRLVSSLLKKDEVPKSFVREPFSKSRPRTRYIFNALSF
jgi:hypothetical protein